MIFPRIFVCYFWVTMNTIVNKNMTMKDIDEKMFSLNLSTNSSTYAIVEMVLSHRIMRGVLQFLVKWEGYSNEYNEWVNDEDCTCDGLISEYFTRENIPINTVYCFCRVSSKNQSGINHVSLKTQMRQTLEASKEYFGFRIKVVQVIGSAYRTIPDKLKQIGDSCRSGDVIIVYRADRFARNVIHYLWWIEQLSAKGVVIRSIEDNVCYHSELNDSEKLKFIKCIVEAHDESARLSNRVRSSLVERRRRGDECLGSTPYGQKLVSEEGTGRLVKVDNPEELKTIDRIVSMSKRGVPYESIADDLNAEGNRKRNRMWSENMVKNIVKNRLGNGSLNLKRRRQ
jgi:DNA invertase Pin-like site-specific DNA recombinase